MCLFHLSCKRDSLICRLLITVQSRAKRRSSFPFNVSSLIERNCLVSTPEFVKKASGKYGIDFHEEIWKEWFAL